MLHHANKFILIIFLICITSCLSEEQKLQRVRDNFNKSKVELQKLRQDIYSYAKNFAGNDSLYKKVHKSMNDSIKVWANNNLGLWKYYKDDSSLKYHIDSILCFNSKKDKLIAGVLRQQQDSIANAESIWFLYGVKIIGGWYFFGGASLILPREYYQEDIHTPLSFETLKLIAVKEIFYNYLKKGKNGQYEINDKFFSDLTSGAWCVDCKTQQQWDSAYLYQINQNWSRRNKD